MNKSIEKLTRHLKENNIDLFFDEIDVLMTKMSDLIDFVTLLKNRYVQLKMDIIRGILSNEEQQSQRDTLIKDMLSMLTLADEDDFKKEVIQKSIAYFHEKITTKQNELLDITNKKVDGVDKVGYSLIKLGGVLRGTEAKSDPNISYAQSLKSASRKALRRVSFACKELEEVKIFQNNCFKEIIQIYRKLIEYLDLPDEEINEQKITLLKQNFEDIKTHNQKLLASKGNMAQHFKSFLPAIQEVSALREVISTAIQKEAPDDSISRKNIDSTFNYFNHMEKAINETIHFFEENDNTTDQLIQQVNELISELKLNLQEL